MCSKGFLIENAQNLFVGGGVPMTLAMAQDFWTPQPLAYGSKCPK